MPELPEVENVVLALRQDLQGRRLGRVRRLRRDVFHGDPRSPRALLPRRTVRAVARTGKRIEITLSDGINLYVHLGMTGRLAVMPRTEPLAPHTHLVVDLTGGDTQLRFRDPRRFGGIWVIDQRRPLRGRPLRGRTLPVARNDVLVMSPLAFLRAMRRHRQIKALLLDQHVLSGMGNIYCDEALFRAGIHPLRRADSLSNIEVRRLHGAIRRVLLAAIRAGGSTIRDYLGARHERGRFQNAHRVYGRAGKPCLRCRAPLIRLTAAGRTSTICPLCQPLHRSPTAHRPARHGRA